MKFLAMKAVFLVVLFCQVSCARLSSDVPKHFDLTGEWKLIESLSDQPPDPTKGCECICFVCGNRFSCRGIKQNVD